MSVKNAKILLTGGGTGGSVAPLLAVAEELRIKNYELRITNFLWLGTKHGPEREMVEKEDIKFKAIANGKFRRYFSWRNFIDPFLIIFGFVYSFFIILKWRPDLVMSAGSFASVPAVWAAWLLRAPVLIHQQDARPGLANKLMAPFANVITVAFEKSLADYGKKAVWTGNPVRQFSIFNFQFSIKEIRKKFGLRDDMPTVLVIGGGTGAMAINELIGKALPELIKFCQIIHITGKDKITNYKLQITNYKLFEFMNIEELIKVYTVADIVVSRCGMGVLTELSYLGKPAILIPMPDSHQEENAAIFAKKKAAIVLNQEELTPEKLADNIKKLLNDEMLRGKLSGNIKTIIKRGANERIAEIVKNILFSTEL
ncbi:undecaprenyldiphospho-muramoylpentapeptide beta-N-acetylglucosaminyltransferase [Patescibacteria group bacterium]|nr:undecaprenyldiphospho-muramoylpentapeptide beta-N-acetylglucosaminyltransferase [Patescibacteria group bacterium]MBU4347421.1 undecaprenyldiphospho-muramoylpentapeptide beta-N-acetylglucosaminyltransferase [Patescibacteria group bacterium]MBU4455734.1 undecaprenyldiphospho-muramoylpentapeptide beta-N-acetylglucosaminyltransferase [Patescibacteria group bacterium]